MILQRDRVNQVVARLRRRIRVLDAARAEAYRMYLDKNDEAGNYRVTERIILRQLAQATGLPWTV